ncbi:collagen alpha-1(I) chain-like [Myiozetetes cayanensis]|uniref:collagen alpha-1(I) chain-like n=1 Tax=Myiozetetes cayanensis TaxID=478635 RepID=UPI00215FD6D5|nr:collagen alpha-1(I) chain-like [Myiozetetes cayanensis]
MAPSPASGPGAPGTLGHPRQAAPLGSPPPRQQQTPGPPSGGAAPARRARGTPRLGPPSCPAPRSFPGCLARLPLSRPGSLARLPCSRQGPAGCGGGAAVSGGSRTSKRGRGSHPAPPSGSSAGASIFPGSPVVRLCRLSPCSLRAEDEPGGKPAVVARGPPARCRARGQGAAGGGPGLRDRPSAPAKPAREGTGSEREAGPAAVTFGQRGRTRTTRRQALMKPRPSAGEEPGPRPRVTPGVPARESGEQRYGPAYRPRRGSAHVQEPLPAFVHGRAAPSAPVRLPRTAPAAARCPCPPNGMSAWRGGLQRSPGPPTPTFSP